MSVPLVVLTPSHPVRIMGLSSPLAQYPRNKGLSLPLAPSRSPRFMGLFKPVHSLKESTLVIGVPPY